MARTPSPKIQERNERLIADWVTGQYGPKTLAEKYGIEAATVRVIVRDSGIRNTNKRGPKKERRPLSTLHARVGLGHLSVWIARQCDRLSDLAIQLGVSERLLADFRQGLGDPTLNELQKLAAYIGCEVHELLNPEFELPPRSDDS